MLDALFEAATVVGGGLSLSQTKGYDIHKAAETDAGSTVTAIL